MDRGLFNLPVRGVQHAGRTQWKIRSTYVHQRRWLLFVTCSDILGDIAVFAARQHWKVHRWWSLCSVGDQILHWANGSHRGGRRRTPCTWSVRLLLDLHSVLTASYILVVVGDYASVMLKYWKMESGSDALVMDVYNQKNW